MVPQLNTAENGLAVQLNFLAGMSMQRIYYRMQMVAQEGASRWYYLQVARCFSARSPSVIKPCGEAADWNLLLPGLMAVLVSLGRRHWLRLALFRHSQGHLGRCHLDTILSVHFETALEDTVTATQQYKVFRCFTRTLQRSCWPPVSRTWL